MGERCRSWLPKIAVGGGGVGVAIYSEEENEEDSVEKTGGGEGHFSRNFSAGRKPLGLLLGTSEKEGVM